MRKQLGDKCSRSLWRSVILSQTRRKLRRLSRSRPGKGKDRCRQTRTPLLFLVLADSFGGPLEFVEFSRNVIHVTLQSHRRADIRIRFSTTDVLWQRSAAGNFRLDQVFSNKYTALLRRRLTIAWTATNRCYVGTVFNHATSTSTRN